MTISEKINSTHRKEVSFLVCPSWIRRSQFVILSATPLDMEPANTLIEALDHIPGVEISQTERDRYSVRMMIAAMFDKMEVLRNVRECVQKQAFVIKPLPTHAQQTLAEEEGYSVENGEVHWDEI